MKHISSILAKRNLADQGKYISREFQDYALRLAHELGDMKHKPLYMRLAKTVPRNILEQARSFVKDAISVRSKAKLFMWKLKVLQQKK